MLVPATAPAARPVAIAVVVVSALTLFVVVAVVGVGVMSTGTMHMPVLELVRPRRTYVQNFNVENQILPGERMVGIEEHLLALDGRNRDDGGVTVAIGLEHVADVELLDRQLAPGHPADELVVAGAVGLLRGNHDHALRARRQAAQGLLETVDDLPTAFEIGDRLTPDRGVEHLALLIAQCEMERDDGRMHALKRRRERETGHRARRSGRGADDRDGLGPDDAGASPLFAALPAPAPPATTAVAV